MTNFQNAVTNTMLLILTYLTHYAKQQALHRFDFMAFMFLNAAYKPF